MGHCIHIHFGRTEEKEAAFDNMKASGHIETVNADTIRIIDPSSNSNNFITNAKDFLELEIEVKTRFLSKFLLDELNQYQCLLQDCEDAEEDSLEPLTRFFRV